MFVHRLLWMVGFIACCLVVVTPVVAAAETETEVCKDSGSVSDDGVTGDYVNKVVDEIALPAGCANLVFTSSHTNNVSEVSNPYHQTSRLVLDCDSSIVDVGPIEREAQGKTYDLSVALPDGTTRCDMKVVSQDDWSSSWVWQVIGTSVPPTTTPPTTAPSPTTSPSPPRIDTDIPEPSPPHGGNGWLNPLFAVLATGFLGAVTYRGLRRVRSAQS